MSEDDARAAIAQVCTFLASAPPQADEPDYSRGERGNEKTSAPLARELARLLLDAADSNGFSGCPLCGS